MSEIKPGSNQWLRWIDERFPLSEFWKKHLSEYYVPRNLNFWYCFGAFSLFVFFNQMLTGIWLAMEYIPTTDGAFASIQHIMREVKFGWLLRFMHTTGASAFFIVIYLHMYRGLIYGSYRQPRELVWLVGMMIYLILLIEAFTGYVLPWGQMSYWGAAVITSFVNAIPYIGKTLLIWLRGDFNITGATLQRFYALHVIAVPLFLVALIYLHLVALHHVGSNNPDGIEIKNMQDKNGVPLDGIPFYPYYTLKNLVGIVVFLIVFFSVVFFAPKMSGLLIEANNSMMANPMQTPSEISPVWYMAPFYAILRAVPNKKLGLITMAAAIAIMFLLPWLDRSPVKSIRYKGWISKMAIIFFVMSFIGLGYLGHAAMSPFRLVMMRLCTLIYFSFYLFMPLYTKKEKTLPVPGRVTQ